MSKWVLPEGIEKVVGSQAYALELLRRDILDLFFSWGYEYTIPPLIDYVDNLWQGIDKNERLQTITSTDESGRLIGFRSDITPQVARIAIQNANYTKNIQRLCFSETVVRSKNEDLFTSKTPTWIGAELYGASFLSAEIEILSLLIETLQLAKLPNLTIELSHSLFMSYMLSASDLSETDKIKFSEWVADKKLLDIKSFISKKILNTELSKLLEKLPYMMGTFDYLKTLRKEFSSRFRYLTQILDQLIFVMNTLEQLYPEVSLRFDLSETSVHSYHSGITFTAYSSTVFNGKPVARGGRYDDLMQSLDSSLPALGFDLNLVALAEMSQVRKQSSEIIWAPNIKSLESNQIKAFWHSV